VFLIVLFGCNPRSELFSTKQSKEDVWREICHLPMEIIEKPVALDGFLNEKIQNKAVQKVFEDGDNWNQATIVEMLQKEEISSQNCPIMSIWQKREVQKERLKCTEQGCLDVLYLSFQPPISYPGNYVFTFSYGEYTRICEYHIPTDNKDVCGSDIFIDSEVVGRNAKLLTGFTLNLAPETFSFEIKRDGKLILDETYTPVYKEYKPNGEGCEPTCKTSQPNIIIPK
jgi:hypothetical protein